MINRQPRKKHKIFAPLMYEKELFNKLNEKPAKKYPPILI